MAEGKIYVATQDTMVDLGGGNTVILKAGVTRVREGHSLLKGRESLFRELDVHYDVETARQAPKAEAKPEPKIEPQVPAPEAKAEEKPAGLTSEDAPAKPAARPRQQRGPRKSS